MDLTAYTVFLLLIALCHGDRPCVKRDTELGSICVCNSTYVDTISAPLKLPTGKFHIYTTAKTKPGFNHDVGYFRIQAVSPNETIIKINVNKTFQTIRGFGGGFTDSFGYNLNLLSHKAQKNLLKSYFAEDGIEYSVCRVVLGSCDFALREYYYLPEYDPTMKSFNLTEDDHIYKISQIKRALKLSKRGIQFLGSFWGSPKWVRMSKSLRISYIKKEFQQLWADYYVKTIEAYKKEGIDFWAVTTGNEPVTLYAGRHYLLNMSAVTMFPEELRDWIVNNLGPTLRESGFNTSIYLLDDMRLYATWYIDTVMREPKSKTYVSGIALHWYEDFYTLTNIFDDMIKKYPGQEIIYSESSFNSANITSILNYTDFNLFKQPAGKVGGPLLGSWERAREYAADIIQNLQHWVTTYIDWNLALDLEGGPNRINFPCDASILINTTNRDEFYKQPMFYIMGHFSKFIPPGSKIIDLQQVNVTERFVTNLDNLQPPLDTKLQYVGALNPNGSLSVILYNPSNTSVKVTLHDLKRGYAVLTIEANSINSVIYW